MAARAEPLSIESLLQKQREEKEAAAKPKFLTKEQRAQLAIQKRAQEIKEQREKEERAKRDREALEREAEEIRARERERERASRYGGGGGRNDDRYDRDRDRDRGDRYGRRGDRDRRPPPHEDRRGGTGGGGGSSLQGVPTGPRADRGKATPTGPASSSTSSMPPPPPPSGASNGSSSSVLAEASQSYDPPITSNDLDAIRSRYLGVDKKKRKIRKMNDRKFVFDWDEQDDTYNAETPAAIGSQRQGAQIGFGRGHIAGMDDAGGAVVPGRKSGAEGMVLADPLERRRAARTGIDERHWSEKSLDEMKERDWRIFREDFSIAARGGQIPYPIRSWRESAIPVEILDIVDQIGYKEPSPIQRQAIPIGLQNRDIIGIAETGSGKTAAFVIPMLAFISKLPPFTDDIRHLGPYALILAPTRELAQQIESETKKFAGPLGFTSVSIVGGRSVEEQQFNLRSGAEIIIATPGRLKDVIERHVIVLSQCRYVVMDEADRMVNLGFEADLTFILDKLPSDTMEGEDQGEQMDIDGETMIKKGRNRVTTLFSATMPPPVERLAKKYLKKPAIITIGEAGKAVDTVEQRVEFVSGDEKKKQRMLEILNSGQFASPIIVFVNQKKTADMVAKDLQRAGWNAATLHSGKNQEQREAALQSLRTGDADLLVATDLAGRGIDVQDVTLVINYQMANTIEAYVHRIGRTGRAGKQGTAITFLSNDDEEVMYDLKQEISKSPVSKVPIELAKHEAAQHKVSREMKRKRDADDQG
ncbi:pre-mRNA-splicing ATP-dependent RNA helicase PRP28 [Dichomitus squalens LYAD-421 SS1]|uniref:RNA helicase n=1 Tax=Dichomitus squalens TaxID=114155 RepID=A0A4Q9N5G3_9APHY|nr:pre-mRNA-splicing ATP-dependent RNA helicase PRP28 [Dichomitus squalens LYAD-421 SS1]EJF65973.1 pre-mRNA-splicing ATP-dependent RNA helicase PRP28 [Dichomitus squalens LYAD-421 SS1]TBU35849.1 pre-mRNA-splicing ATP-dependent RNA helicase PRP28 [Dichomitus squalens]TBU65698.1 pre-mRNA-splicing ATP-dependent RNA helicase PRP28 [Dichomitus squalens]